MDAKERQIRIVLLLLLLYAAGCLASAGRRVHRAEAALERLTPELERLERTASPADAPLDDAAIEALARQRLGLVLPGETIFLFPEEESG